MMPIDNKHDHTNTWPASYIAYLYNKQETTASLVKGMKCF